MATIKVHGGDFVAGEKGSFTFGVLTLPMRGGSFFGIPVSKKENIPLSTVMRVQAVNKEMKHRTEAAVGRGLVGAIIGGTIVGGPVTGAIVGFTTTNHTSDVTFEAEFEGGRRLLATTNTATYTKLLAAAFDYKPPQERAVLDQSDEAQFELSITSLTAIIIIGLLVLVGLADHSAWALGIAVGAAIFFFGNKIVRKLNPEDRGTSP
jgi:hypothetical protein